MNRKSFKRPKLNGSQLCLHLILAPLCVIMILPFMWMVATSLRLPIDSFGLPPQFFPTSFYYQNYLDVFAQFPFFKFIQNSFVVAVIVVTLNVMVTTLSAFAFARIPFKGRNVIFLIFLLGTMIPSQVTMIPVFLIISKMGLVGSLWALVFPAIINPMGIFFVRQFMMTIPASYEEAAYIDGANRFVIFWKIFLPMSRSVIIMISVLCFLGSWNDFMGPLLYLSKFERMTLPIGLRILSGYMGGSSVSMILAGVVMSLVVPAALYMFGQKYIIQGTSLSGLKS